MSAAAGAEPVAAGTPPGPRPRHWRVVALGLVSAALLTSPWWGPAALGSLEFFRVRKVEVDGVRYLAASEVLARLRVDTSASIWDDVRPYERRLAGHPLVASVRVERKLPGTLVVRVMENLPVALVSGTQGGALRVVDGAGRALPIDPSQTSVDVPIVRERDTALLRLLDEVRDADPRLFARISEARRVGRRELLLELTADAPAAEGGGAAGVPVRAMADVTVGRLAEIYPVESDLARRRLRAAEIDLRYRDQVIARLQ